jgi:predicted transcriptional regulator
MPIINLVSIGLISGKKNQAKNKTIGISYIYSPKRIDVAQ